MPQEITQPHIPIADPWFFCGVTINTVFIRIGIIIPVIGLSVYAQNKHGLSN